MKYTNDQLLQVSLTYKTFSELLKNRKLYYLLHNRGILKEATKHMTRKKPRNKYTKSIVDISKLIAPVYFHNKYNSFRDSCMSNYVILRRHGLDPEEIFENKNNMTYIKKILRQFGQDQIAEFLEKSE